MIERARSTEETRAKRARVERDSVAGAAEYEHKNGNQDVLFTAIDRAVIDKLRASDLDDMKPIDALNLLAELKKQVSELPEEISDLLGCERLSKPAQESSASWIAAKPKIANKVAISAARSGDFASTTNMLGPTP